jgi:hypothetical protein
MAFEKNLSIVSAVVVKLCFWSVGYDPVSS